MKKPPPPEKILDDKVCESLALQCEVHDKLVYNSRRAPGVGNGPGAACTFGIHSGKLLLFYYFFGYEEAKQNGWMVFRFSSPEQARAYLPAIKAAIDKNLTYVGLGEMPDNSLN